MRIGPKEKGILLLLKPGEFVPPSIYLGDYGRCPSGDTLNRLVYEKKLAVMQHNTWTAEERRRRTNDTPPGWQTAEINAALRLTKEGEVIVEKLRCS